MYRTLIWALPLLLLLPAARGQDAAKRPTSQTRSRLLPRSIAACGRSSKTSNKPSSRSLRKPRRRRKKQKPSRNGPSPRITSAARLNAVQKAPKEPFALDALLWVAQLGQGSPAGNKALDMLVKDHIQSEKLVEVCDVLSYSGDASAGKYLETIMEKTPHRDVKGRACYALAHHLKGIADESHGKKARRGPKEGRAAPRASRREVRQA